MQASKFKVEASLFQMNLNKKAENSKCIYFLFVFQFGGGGHRIVVIPVFTPFINAVAVNILDLSEKMLKMANAVITNNSTSILYS